MIILQINGFSLHQAKRYIYEDTIFLTIIGLMAGCIGGIYFAKVSVASFQNEYIYPIQNIDAPACIIAVLATAFLTTVMTLLALERIRKFKLEDINRMG